MAVDKLYELSFVVACKEITPAVVAAEGFVVEQAGEPSPVIVTRRVWAINPEAAARRLFDRSMT